MSLGKYAINFVIVFLLYGIFMTVLMMVNPVEMNTIARPEGASEAYYIMIGHAVQTIGFVWLFMKTMTGSCVKEGALFGLMFGLVLIGTDAVYFGSMNIPAEVIHASMINNIIGSVLVGAVTAFAQRFLNKNPK